MPAEAVDASVDGEWSLTQTMRHLILATDLWLGQAVLGLAQPFDPIGLPNEDGDSEAFDRSFFATASPSLDEVMAVRITRQQLVRDYLARVTAADLAVPRPNPHAPTHQETTLSCIGTILEEDAVAIEEFVRAALENSLVASGNASAIQFTVSRLDNLLSTRTLTCTAGIQPKGYLKTINLGLSYVPVVAVAA